MIGKGATPSFFAIANDNYTLTSQLHCNTGLNYLNREDAQYRKKAPGTLTVNRVGGGV